VGRCYGHDEGAMDFRILGPLEVRDGETTIPLAGGKQRAVLAILILNANETVSTDRLIEELWGERPPASAPKVIQNHVSQLRRAFADGLLMTQRAGYTLRLEPGTVDVVRFERLLEDGRRALAHGDAEKASALLREALSLWRGPPLADFIFESFAQPEIARLDERRLVALEERIEADLALGRHTDLVGELQGLVGEHPVRERLHCQLMLCLYRSGRQAEALEVYQDARKVLVEELGIEPGRPLRELHQAILQQDPALELQVTAGPARETGLMPFVGRENQLGELRAGLDDAFVGTGRLFLLVGGPGIGKSRLAEELLSQARARGARVIVGRCWEAGGAPAYWPWVQALRTYVGETDPRMLRTELGAGTGEIVQILPELRELFPDLPEPIGVESEGARFRLFDAVAEFLARASANRPLAVFLDDLHAADAASLLLLQFVARVLSSTRTLVIGAYRDVDPTPGESLTGTLGELAREPITSRLSLGGLDEDEIGQYLELTASELASPDVVAALYDRTEGNPLFVQEIVRLLSVEGLPRASDSAVRLAVPESIRDVIARRLAHLSEECNGFLLLGSVLGREFALDGLARLGGVPVEDALDALDEAMAARVVADAPGAAGRLRFTHVLIRDTLYEGLTTAHRVRLHRQAVGALEGLYGDDAGRHLAELAHHAIAANAFDKGLDYARRAGDRALTLLAYEEAARFYETALSMLDHVRPSDERARCELMLSLGEAEARAGNMAAAKQAFVDAADLARRQGLARELAVAAAGYGGRLAFGRAGDDERLVPLLEEALTAVGDADVELQARLLARLAGALRDEASRDRRDSLSSEAVNVARRSGNLSALAFALDGRAGAIVAPDTVDEFSAVATELRDVATRIGDKERLVAAHSHLSIARLFVGDVRGAEANLEAAGSIADELKQPVHLWRVSGERAMLALATGRLSEAEDLVERTYALGRQASPDAAIPVYVMQRRTLSEFRGRLEEAESAVADMVVAYPARTVFRCALTQLHARLGRLEAAKRVFEELAEGGFAALPFDQEWLYAMSLLAETCTLLRDEDSAPLLYESLLPYANLNGVDVTEGFAGSVSRYLGLLAGTMGHRDQAGRHFQAALAMNERMAALPWLAYTQHDYARLLLAGDSRSDRARGRSFLDVALATCRDVGMEIG
jgi:DNA-binding SARP family transcriptional activator